MIDGLVAIASSEKDNATQDFLWGFVREQVEEEANASEIVEKLEMIGDNISGLFYLDGQLGARKD